LGRDFAILKKYLRRPLNCAIESAKSRLQPGIIRGKAAIEAQPFRNDDAHQAYSK